MLRLLTLCILISLAIPAQSQVPDFISVKKRNGVSVKNYYAGLNISFIAKDGRRYDALIDKIANDSIYLRYFTLAPYTNIIGTTSYDTITTYILGMSYKGIQYIITPKIRYRNHYLSTLGRYAAIGGLGYSFLNLFNGITQDQGPVLDDRNTRNLIISTGIGAAGLALNRIYRNAPKSRKYKIVYVDMSVDQQSKP